MLENFVRFLNSMLSSPTTEAGKIGRMGEDLATKFLKQKGYKIIKRNFRSKNNEIDIICQHQDVLVFIEVKTRTNLAKVSGYFSAVGKRKKKCCAHLCQRLHASPKTQT